MRSVGSRAPAEPVFLAGERWVGYCSHTSRHIMCAITAVPRLCCDVIALYDPLRSFSHRFILPLFFHSTTSPGYSNDNIHLDLTALTHSLLMGQGHGPCSPARVQGCPSQRLREIWTVQLLDSLGSVAGPSIAISQIPSWNALATSKQKLAKQQQDRETDTNLARYSLVILPFPLFSQPPSSPTTLVKAVQTGGKTDKTLVNAIFHLNCQRDPLFWSSAADRKKVETPTVSSPSSLRLHTLSPMLWLSESLFRPRLSTFKTAREIRDCEAKMRVCFSERDERLKQDYFLLTGMVLVLFALRLLLEWGNEFHDMVRFSDDRERRLWHIGGNPSKCLCFLSAAVVWTSHLSVCCGAVRGRFLKDENGDISDHLRNHVHLTNCIHLKNHMHRQSPILAERSLMRDLIVLQRSRSLRDPSTSPPSWHSPSVIDSLARKLEEESGIQRGRRSIGVDRRREPGRLSASSPPVASIATSKLAAAEAMRETEGAVGFGGRASTHRMRDARSKGEESSRRARKSDVSAGSERPIRDSQDLGGIHASVSQKVETKDRKNSLKGDDRGSNVYLKTLSERLKELPADSEDVESSRCRRNGRYMTPEQIIDAPETSMRGYCNGMNRAKRRKFRGTRRARVSIGSWDTGAPNEMSVASNSLASGTSTRPKYYIDEREDDNAKLEVTRVPRNGCGIPWNWSRIHHRGKTILDMAGRSLSCGLSDSRLRKATGTAPRSGRDDIDMPVMASDQSSASPRSDSEALPLLSEPSGSQGSIENVRWAREYSGELGIFANHSLRHEQDLDLASEARSGDRRNSRGHHRGRHRSLTQKYMPRIFKDLIGQNLVVQALSNAIVRRKVGLLYVFYGPHGTGKTSCARIFARALNCQSLEHPKPCGVCNACIAHDLGKSRNVIEVSPVGNFDFENMIDLLDNMVTSQLPSQYRVLIVDDCDTLPPDSWTAILKVIDLAPRRVVFVLVSTSLDHLPHIIASRCQKFFFPKLKDADIIYTLQWISTKEDLEIDKDALKLIASRSDGSLRDAEMTLDQLSLLGQKISVPLVQELVGLISDDKLVDLLDLALSADTVNTVKNLREIMEAGVEPLALMSQLATIITDILAGSYRDSGGNSSADRYVPIWFQYVSKEDMEKLRQALKTLSEAEKQLRTSNDRLTWLTAALLQLAPDHQYILPSSSMDTSFNHSPLILKNNNMRDNGEQAEIPDNARSLMSTKEIGNQVSGSTKDVVMQSDYAGGNKHAMGTPMRSAAFSTDVTRANVGQIPGKGYKEIEEIWLAVLERIQINSLKQFMLHEGKMVSVSSGAARTSLLGNSSALYTLVKEGNTMDFQLIQDISSTASTAVLVFNSHANKSKAEKFRGHILQAFESVLGSPVTIEIRYESRKDGRGQVSLISPPSRNGVGQMSESDKLLKTGPENQIEILSNDRVARGIGATRARHLKFDTHETSKSEIVEIESAPWDSVGNIPKFEEKTMGRGQVEEVTTSNPLALGFQAERRKIGEQPQMRSLVRGKVSLAHVIQQAEGCTQRNGWSRRKAISIAEKLEQENLFDSFVLQEVGTQIQKLALLENI
ncbi:hypothetical protein ACLOJK_010673 [Asimina triloba]